MQTNSNPTDYTRRSNGAHGEGGARASIDLAGPDGLALSHVYGAPLSYQGSAEPFRKPDHKAKRHARPSDWAERHERRQRREREYAI